MTNTQHESYRSKLWRRLRVPRRWS